MYYVYILECADGSFYTGITTNVERRFTEHKAGTASRYTAARGAVAMRYVESCDDRSTASKREHEIKQLSRTQKMILVKK